MRKCGHAVGDFANEAFQARSRGVFEERFIDRFSDGSKRSGITSFQVQLRTRDGGDKREQPVERRIHRGVV